MSDSDKNTVRDTIKHITETLGETDKKPVQQIKNIVKLCGVDFANNILKETLEVEANGGMTITNGDRRRTIGGVFFHLAREQMEEEYRQQIFFSWRNKRQRRKEREAQFPVFDYDNERAEVIKNLLEDVGKVNDVNITLTGQPAATERRRDLIILTMQDQIDGEFVFPSGVPQPDYTPISYTVYISAKQWERVESSVENDADDDLIIEGKTAFDSETGSMAVYATYVTTEKIKRKQKRLAKQQQQQQAQKKQSRKSSNDADSGQAKKPPKAKKEGRAAKGGQPRNQPAAPTDFTPIPDKPAPIPDEPEIEINLPEGIPADAAEKLTGLYKAAATFRQKIAALEAKPADEQFGLEMTQKLLKNTETQIQRIEQEYKSE